MKRGEHGVVVVRPVVLLYKLYRIGDTMHIIKRAHFESHSVPMYFLKVPKVLALMLRGLF